MSEDIKVRQFLVADDVGNEYIVQEFVELVRCELLGGEVCVLEKCRRLQTPDGKLLYPEGPGIYVLFAQLAVRVYEVSSEPEL